MGVTWSEYLKFNKELEHYKKRANKIRNFFKDLRIRNTAYYITAVYGTAKPEISVEYV